VLLTSLPNYYEEVAHRLLVADWMVNNFHSPESSELYNPINYIFKIQSDPTNFRASLDLNVLQYTVNCVKKPKQTDSYRTACAMLLFCRAAEITLEPNLAVYERINYGDGNVEEALDDLAILRALDNTNAEQLAAYMLGDDCALQSITPQPIDRPKLREKLTEYNRLTHWDSIYVLVLGLVRVQLDETTPHNAKFLRFVDWMICEYRLSLPCLVYAARLFGCKPYAKMMKYRPNQPRDSAQKALRNMTWDLFYVDHYFKNLVDPQPPWKQVLFSQDVALRGLLRDTIRIQYERSISPLHPLLHDGVGDACQELLVAADSRSDRAYGTKQWAQDYRAKLIQELEAEIGLVP
jgi:hypothetical protein